MLFKCPACVSDKAQHATSDAFLLFRLRVAVLMRAKRLVFPFVACFLLYYYKEKGTREKGSVERALNALVPCSRVSPPSNAPTASVVRQNCRRFGRSPYSACRCIPTASTVRQKIDAPKVTLFCGSPHTDDKQAHRACQHAEQSPRSASLCIPTASVAHRACGRIKLADAPSGRLACSMPRRAQPSWRAVPYR